MITNIYYKYTESGEWEEVTPSLEDYIISIDRECTSSNTSFQLGDTNCLEVKFSINKMCELNVPVKIKVVDSNANDSFTVNVDEVDDEDDTNYFIDCLDNMTQFNFKYDATLNNDMDTGVTLLTLVQDMCSQAGVELGTTSFFDSTKVITWYDSEITARTYIGYVAENNGGYAYIDADGKLCFAQYGTVGGTVDINECGDISIGEKHEITRVVYESGTATITLGDETGDTLYINSDNTFITVEDSASTEVTNIYNIINGFTFYNLESSDCPITTALCGQIINFTLDENTYPTIAQISQSYNMGWSGGYKLSLQTQEQQETSVINSTSESVKSLKITVDRTNNEIEQLAKTVSSDSEQISSLNQTTSSIQSTVADVQKNYATNEELSKVSTSVKQTSEDITLEVSERKAADSSLQDQLNTYGTYFKFNSDGLSISKDNSNNRTTYTDDGMEMYTNDSLVAKAKTDGFGTVQLILGEDITSDTAWHIVPNGNHLMFTRRVSK